MLCDLHRKAGLAANQVHSRASYAPSTSQVQRLVYPPARKQCCHSSRYRGTRALKQDDTNTADNDVLLEAAAEPPPSVNPNLLRRAAGVQSVNELVDLLLHDDTMLTAPTDEQCRAIMLAAIERSNTQLAVVLFEAMKAASLPSATPSSPSASSSSTSADTPSSGLAWPTASLDTAAALVVSLTRSLAIKDALRIIGDLRHRGMPQADEVRFGHVVPSPLAVSTPLSVVQPLEGVKVVACATSRYEFELFSGTVTKVSSEATVSTQGWLLAIARGVGLWRRPPTGAIHEMIVATPGGLTRTFRVATATADVPAKEGDRVTMICCPAPGNARKRGLLPSTPPGYKAGEPLYTSNHTTGIDTPVQRPPNAAGDRLPGWVLPVAVLLAGGDAASYLIDPALPLIAASTAAALVGTSVVGTTFVLPEARRLPAASVAAETIRCRLLEQHTSLYRRLEELTEAAGEDVTTLARLWQLQTKMGKAGAPYQVRAERVTKACAGLEQRLTKRLELIDGYARVLNMIEIEVELDTQVPDEEMLGIEQQIMRLEEVEELQEQWQLQAEAQEEVEKLLRAA